MHAERPSVQPSGSWPSIDDELVFETPVIEVGDRVGHRKYLAASFRHPDFLIRYPVAVLRAKHRETLLGLGWEVLNPMLLIFVWWIIRGVVFPSAGGSRYLEFLTVSVFTFQYLQRAVTGGQSAIASSKGLLQSFHFPPLVAVVQQSITHFVSNLFSVGVLLGFILVLGETPTWGWVLFAPVLLMQATFGLGGSMIVARLTAQNPDVRNMVPFAFRLLFYASGVIFPIEDRLANSDFRLFFELNPFYSITAVTRSVLLGQNITGVTLFGSIAWVLLVPFIGYFVFRTGDDRYVV